MEWYESVFELIDLRSFSNLWYWLALAVFWSSASYRVMGVPYDMITRAARLGGQAEEDMEDLARINTNRILTIMDISGVWLIGIVSFVLTVLLALGFVYRIEFAQAVALLLGPMTIVGFLAVGCAQDIRRRGLAGKPLRSRLILHRRLTQIVGMFAILVTGVWGMWQNMAIGVLGG